MPVIVWIVAFFLFVTVIGLFVIIRQQQGSLKKSGQALYEAQKRSDALEKTFRHQQNDRESTENRLRNYLSLLDTLINTMPNPIYFKSVQGTYQGCNKVFAKQILGLTRDRIIGQRPQDLPAHIPPDLAATYLRQELIMRAKGAAHSFEGQVLCADGQYREFLFNLAPFRDEKNQISGCVAVLSDLTEKNRAAQDRLQKEKLQGVLETAGAVCHELNQPLQVLYGYTELLDSKMTALPEAQADLAHMARQIDRIRRITSKLQGITRYETTNYAGNTKIIDIHKSSR